MGRNPILWFLADLSGRLPQRRFLDRQDRPRRLRATAFSLLTLFLGFAYLLWLTYLVLRNRGIPDFLFLGAEIVSFLLLGLMAYDVWHLRGHSPEGPGLQLVGHRHRPGSGGPGLAPFPGRRRRPETGGPHPGCQ